MNFVRYESVRISVEVFPPEETFGIDITNQKEILHVAVKYLYFYSCKI
jgi:hypothetical protein